MDRRFQPLLILALTGGAAFGQIGQPYPGAPYPGTGGGYPGTGYPGGQQPIGGGGLSLPGRRGKKTVPTQVTDTLTGKIRRISTSELILEPEDRRVITVSIEKNTQYATTTGAAKYGDFDPGDEVSVDAARDTDNYLHAVKITLQKKAGATVSSSAENGPRAQITAGDEPNTPEERPATTMAPKPLPPDPDDPGRPVLRRGAPNPPPSSAPLTINSSARAERREEARAEAPRAEARPVRQAPAAAAQGHVDPVIESARESAFNFTETLPNYQVKQFTTRYETGAAQGDRTQWRANDVVTADVLYEDGKESYKNLQINGKPAKDKIEKSGSWSTGEFATVLRDILSPSSDADFFNKRSATVSNRPAWRYDYTVEQPNSHWQVVASAETYFPAYKGSIWIDKENSRVLRIEMSSHDIPKDFPLDKVESATEYEYVLISDKKFLLPTHSEALSCVRGSGICTKNVIEFRNYRKFGAESDIKFDPQ